MDSLQMHHDIRNNIREIILNKEDDNEQICIKLNDYLEQFLSTKSRGILRTILTTLKPIRKIKGFDVIYEKYFNLFQDLGGTN